MDFADAPDRHGLPVSIRRTRVRPWFLSPQSHLFRCEKNVRRKNDKPGFMSRISESDMKLRFEKKSTEMKAKDSEAVIGASTTQIRMGLAALVFLLSAESLA